MGNVQLKGKEELSLFQRKKLKYEFYTFFDLNHDGCLTYNDFLWAKDKICFMSGWKIDSHKYRITEELFTEIWKSLEYIADINKDGKISRAEWLAMWTVYKKEIMKRVKKDKDFMKNFYHKSKQQHELDSKKLSAAATDGADKHSAMNGSANNSNKNNGRRPSDSSDDDLPVVLDSDEEPLSMYEREERRRREERDRKAEELEQAGKQTESEPEKTVLEQFAEDKSPMDESVLPKWLYKYLVFRFNLLDRTGDNIIDNEEYEYVLSEFGVSAKTARQAFTIFTKNNTLSLDFEYFVQLFEQYYLSDDPSHLGNYINGKLSFEDGADDDVDYDVDPGLVDHHMRSGTSFHSMDDDLHPRPNASKQQPQRSAIHEKTKRLYDDFQTHCCAVS